MSARILIVEDDRLTAKMLYRRFQKRGYQIDMAENGRLGVDKALTIRPDLVLMDMHMPVMSGYQAVQLLRRRGYQGQIVGLSASAMAVDKQKALEAGCNYFFSKPVERNFEATVADLLRGKRENGSNFSG